MIKNLLSVCAALYCATSAHATISVAGDFGLLKDSTGTVNVPVGGLLQLIASPSGSASNFAAPTPTSFVSGDNIIVATFAMNYNSGTAGESTNSITLTLQNTAASTTTTFDAGDPLLLRWYPTLTTSSTAPGLGATYGQFRTDATTDGGSPWVTPNDGANNYLLYLITQSTGGSQPNSFGFASNTVPEPSMNVILCLSALGFFGFCFYRRFHA